MKDVNLVAVTGRNIHEAERQPLAIQVVLNCTMRAQNSLEGSNQRRPKRVRV